MSLAAEIIYNAAIPFIKVSILLLYHRIFPQQWLNRALLWLGSFILAYSIAQIFADIFQCIPVDSLWGASPNRYCINYPLLIKICGVINILTDVAILALPMPSLLKLNLSASRKRLLMITFSIGGIACVGAIVRLFYVDKIGNSYDATWDYGIPALVANVELCVGVLAANLPTYRPLITTITSSRHATDTRRTPQVAGSYLPVKDSLQVPLSSLFIKQGVSSTDLDRDNVEMLSGKHQVYTHISGDSGAWPKGRNNEIRVTTSFNAS
ncbi:hypothetical protein BU26DRAFT_434462 [Trematosphaeria pertusa]|uniref:Rhodopsin domain-containing protein n=1 Tax=Trematosphaeria pertusa TaxID=390896 RepID=A0A6A6I3H2_9PLEO|nr:uncharacterized protein BU26DRAFT_434462 [Trematosphaeria pertusa]KAF2245034.1 hypothetical protein BU26DRAFT_434462 [Trematosphaeria pertusa]